jgi:hypothetical protein
VSTSVAEQVERDAPDHYPHLRWWREVLYVLAFYGIYSFVRNQFGSAAVSSDTAFDNARRIIDLQEAIGLSFEEGLQDAFLDATWFIKGWNIFYGTFHFVVTAFALGYLFRCWKSRYVRWRTTLACTTALALIGFALFPLMPPRLLPASYGYVDTLAEIGGLWSFDSDAMADISNQYAAMPSLHFAWSAWSAFVLVPALRQRWLRVLVLAYPVATVFAIIVTANHFWLDAAGGAIVLATGYLLGSLWDRWTDGGREPVEPAVPAAP